MIVFTLVLLGFCWWSENHSLATKIVFSVLVLISLGMAFVEHRYLFHLVQLVLIIAMGVSTFGVEWLSQRVR